MKYLKFEYISIMIFFWSTIIFCGILALAPLAIAITLTIILHDCLPLLLLLVAPFSISIMLCIIGLIIDEMRDVKEEYETRKKLYKIIGLK